MPLASTCFTYILHEIDFRLMKTGQKCHIAVFFVFSNFCDFFYAVHHEFQVQYIKRRPWLLWLYRVSVTAASLLFSSISLWNRDISLARTLTLYNSTRNFLSINLTWDGWHFRRGEFYVIASSAHFSRFQLRDRPPDLSYFINVKKYKGWPTTGDGPPPVTLPYEIIYKKCW